MKIFIRILGLIPYAIFTFIMIVLKLWIKHLWYYLKHGGESIVYLKKDEIKTISDIYETLKSKKV